MFCWSFHAHPTPSHPFRLPNKYIPILLRYAPIIVELGPCCYPEYLPSILFPGMERRLRKEENEIFYMEIKERLMRLISDDEEVEELKRKNGAPPLSINGEEPQLFPRSDSLVDASCYGSFDMGIMRQWQAPFGCGFPGMERKLSKEEDEIFYMEIEERLMRLISDDDDEGEELKKKNGAPPLSINAEEPQLFPRSDSFVDSSCYGSFDMGIMRQWQAPFGCGNCQSAWLTYELEKVRRSALATGRKGTGVFIPRYISA